MAIKEKVKNRSRIKRKLRVKSKIFGTVERPRLSVFRSLNNIYAQIIDDENGHTLVSSSSLEKSFTFSGTKKEVAHEVGKNLANKAKEKSIKNVIFDRNGYLFHGRVKEVAEGARQNGLEF